MSKKDKKDNTKNTDFLLFDTEMYKNFQDFCTLFDMFAKKNNPKEDSEIIIIDNKTGKIIS